MSTGSSLDESDRRELRPVNLRRGRRTIVTLPSGEEVVFQPDREGGHLRLMVSVPAGALIEHLPDVRCIGHSKGY